MLTSHLSARAKMVLVVAVGSVNLIAASVFLLSFAGGGPSLGVHRLDFEVYRIAAQVWVNGGDLYGDLPTTSVGIDLPFTYPPLAAALLSPSTLVPLPVGSTVLTVLTIVVLGAVIAMVLDSLGVRSAGRRHWLLVGMLLPVAMFLEPVRSTLGYGQINILLMAVVVLDCLAKTPRWPRGALIGLAAAVKLTPAAFVLFLLLRRDYRATVTAVLSFLAATSLGFLVAWSDSIRFWSSVVYDTDRIGLVHYAGNQSIMAVLARVGVESSGRGALWLALVLLVVGFAATAMLRAFAAGLSALALGFNALAAVVASPVSWSHHWVWSVPVLLGLAVTGWRARTWLPTSLAIGGVLLFAVSPQWWWYPETADLEYRWGLGQQLVGSSYLYFAVLVLVLAAFDRVRCERPKCCPIGHLWSHRRERHSLR
jgi:alpha-1,2-mannosyltransferase